MRRSGFAEGGGAGFTFAKALDLPRGLVTFGFFSGGDGWGDGVVLC